MNRSKFSKPKSPSLNSNFLLLSLVILACFFAAIFALYPNNDFVKISNETSIDWSDSWDINGSTISLPHFVEAKANEDITISKTINNVFENSGMSISFISSMQRVTVAVEDEVIYSYNLKSNLYMHSEPPPAWHLIRLTPSMMGEKLSITYSSPFDGYGGILGKISAGSKFANVATFVSERLISLLLCFAIFIFGVICIIINGFSLNKVPSLSGIFHLGIFACLISLWSACETRMLQILTGNVQLIMTISFLSISLAPIAFIFFFKDRFSGVWVKISTVLIGIFICYFLSVLVLQGFGIITYNTFFMAFLVAFGLCIALIGVGLTLNLIKEPTRNNFLSVLAIAFLIIFGIVDLVKYIYSKLGPARNTDVTMFFRIGVLLFILTLGYQMARRIIGYYTDSIASNSYKVLANTDSLTGLFNRAYLEDVYGKIFCDSIRNNQSFAVLMIDIDNFKNYNDNYGHVEGDMVIKNVSQAIKSAARRPLDGAVRYGGEEFLIILPNIDAQGALYIAGLVSTAIESLAIPHGFSAAGKVITVSQGVYSAVPTPDQGLEDFINMADQALYRAKSSGKNCFCLYDEKIPKA